MLFLAFLYVVMIVAAVWLAGKRGRRAVGVGSAERVVPAVPAAVGVPAEQSTQRVSYVE